MGFDPQPQQIEAGSGSGAKRELQLHTGPFVLRTLLDDVPLSEDGEHDDIKINCVDYLGVYSLPLAGSRVMTLLTFSSLRG